MLVLKGKYQAISIQGLFFITCTYVVIKGVEGG
jgi:hypothetical protein